MTAPGAPADEEVEEEDGRQDAPGQPHTEDQAAVDHGHRVDQLPGQAAAGGCQQQDGAQQPITGLVGEPGPPLDAEPAAQPLGGIGDGVHRADPTAIDPAADQQIKDQHDGRAHRGVSGRHLATGQHLEQEQGIGQGQDLQGQAGGKVALDDPDTQPGPGEKHAQHDQLAEPARQQPAVGTQPALALDGLGTGPTAGLHRLLLPRIRSLSPISDASPTVEGLQRIGGEGGGRFGWQRRHKVGRQR